MISFLRGVLRSKIPNQLVLDVSGVGYDVLCTLETFERAPGIGEDYEVYTRLIVREDSMTLFGFSTLTERQIFDQLINVKGVGPKTGLAILSAAGVSNLVEAIRAGSVATLTSIPGIGRKTAELLIVELRDKLLKDELLHPQQTESSSDRSQARVDALQALVALGYPRAVAEKSIRSVIRDDPKSAEKADSLIKAALREAVKA
jgi:Holliday junction DNA helicase RuvA